LPAPQISDLELEEVVKLGLASEQARQQAEEAGSTQTVTGQLLGNYQMTPDISRLRTPMLPSNQDSILTESQNILALQIVDTPLKGGENTPLHNLSFNAPTPGNKVVQTPNTMFQTPYRTPHGEITATPSRTPANNQLALVVSANGVPQSPALTSIRDKLSINPEDGLTGFEDKERQKEYLNDLKKSLSRLPAPKNDYEIVLPEDEEEKKASKKKKSLKEMNDEELRELERDETVGEQYEILDEAEVQARRKEFLRAKYEEEFKQKAMAIQRGLPRPSDMNHNILRPVDMMQPLNDYQQAEEMIKEEMLVMLHHDVITDPTLNQCGIPAGSKKPAKMANLKPLCLDKHRNYLKEKGYERFSPDEIENAKKLVEKETPVIRKVMGHGELTSEAYAQVWEECYSQVLYIPSSNRFTSASVTSRKDKIESYEKKLEINRFHMSNEAKKAAKIEQKLRITLGGYQAKAQVLIKSLCDMFNQIESKQIELNTFEHIREVELNAIQKRTQLLEEDVLRQKEREKELQKKFGELILERDTLLNKN